MTTIPGMMWLPKGPSSAPVGPPYWGPPTTIFTMGSNPHSMVLGANSYLYTADTSATLNRLNLADDSIDTFTIGTWSNGIAVSPNGALLYIVHGFSNRVLDRVVAATGVVATISTAPHDLSAPTFTNDSAYFFAVSSTTNSLIQVVTSTNSLTIYPTGSFPVLAKVSPDQAYVFTNNTSGSSVTRLNIVAGTTLDIAVGSSPNVMEYTPNGVYLFVLNAGSNSITRVTVATGATLTIPLGSKPEYITFLSDSSTAFVTSLSNDVYRIDVSSGGVTSIGVGSSTVDLILSPDESLLFASSATTIRRIVVATNAVSSLSTSTQPRTPFLSPDGTRLYFVENSGARRLIRIVIATSSVAYVVLGSDPNPYSRVFSPDNSLLFMADYSDGDIFRIVVATESKRTITMGSPIYPMIFNPADTAMYSMSSIGANNVLKIPK